MKAYLSHHLTLIYCMYRPWSALLHLKSVSFSKRFIPYRLFKSFREKLSVQSVRKYSGVFIVIIKMANWQWSRKLTHLFWEYFFNFIYQDLFCEPALTYRITLNFNYVSKTRHRVFSFMVECKNRSSCMYLYLWGKLRVNSEK